MNWFKSLFGNKQRSTAPESQSFTLRQGKSVPVDDAFRAWASGDLDKMLKAATTDTNPVDRHFLLQSIVGASYKHRLEDKYRNICIEYSELHLKDFPNLAPALKEDMDGVLPRITTFQHYATALAEIGQYDKAISVCEMALKWGLEDGTKSGFEGRISRIRKQAEKSA